MTEFCTVLVTAGSEDEAATIARTLVEERLAACCSIIPAVRSVYRWEGAVQDERETLLVIKTAAAMFPRLEERIRALHSYDVPEIIALPIVEGSADYLAWLGDAVQQDGSE